MADLPPAALVYLNGVVLPAVDARLPVNDRGLLYGMGFFETFRTSGGRPHGWSYHRERLTRACATAGLKVPASFLARDDAKLSEIVRRLLVAHGIADAVFRYTVTAGAETPTEFLSLRPLPNPAPSKGISLRVLKLARDSGEWLPRPKSLNYLNTLLGAEEVRRRSGEPSDEGLFLARETGLVVETARQNIAWISGAQIFYPDPSLGPVMGTCLTWLLELDVAAQPRRAALDEFVKADAIFVLNAVRGITPVCEVWDSDDRVKLGMLNSPAHPLVMSLCQQWTEALTATASAPTT